MEQFVLLQGTDSLKDSREILNNNMLSVRSLSSGTAFPTDNLSEGMLCYRTDLQKIYQYQKNGSWSADVKMNISGNANTANSADTADKCTGNAATATAFETPRNINGVPFDGTDDVTIDVGIKTVNGTKPDANGDVLVASLPIGHIYQSFNPNIPVGSLPLFGGEYSREAYADLWAWVQTQTGYLITEAEWQEMATANEGNVPHYSDGDGSTTFRVPSISCWVKGANGIEEVGSYLQAGLPNITGIWTFMTTDASPNWETYPPSGAATFGNYTYTRGFGSGAFIESTTAGRDLRFNASLSNPIYGNSDTVQPKSIVGMWLVKAFGTVSNVGNQDIADVSAGLTQAEQRISAVEDNMQMLAPTGTVIAFAANSAPDGFLLCNGAAVSRTTYADLFAKIGTTYGTGDGSTTFNLPNLTDKFIQGSGTAGTVKSAGLPNITGSMDWVISWTGGTSGAFYTSSTTSNGDSGSGDPVGRYYKFDASRSNSIYGASSTVQPPSVTMRYYIKY